MRRPASLPLLAFSSMYSAQHEVIRIREHLFEAEALARRHSTAGLGLDPAQRLTRALLLDELARYRAEGVFPRNHDAPTPRPTFIDEHGTRCAMAHLMEIGGAGDLVAEVARTNNHAYVEELARDARVTDWLRAAGLTVEEAARIQPAYCQTAAACLCSAASVDLWEGTVIDAPYARHGVQARVDIVHRAHVRDASAVQPGDVVRIGRLVGPAPDFGTRVFVSNGALVATIDGGELGDVVGGTCAGTGYMFRSAELPPIWYARAVDLILRDKATCMSSLAGEDVRWTNGCDRRAPLSEPGNDASADSAMQASPADAGGGGCSVATSSPDSLAVLFAVLSALAVRRRQSFGGSRKCSSR